jgi:hypothetical protein
MATCNRAREKGQPAFSEIGHDGQSGASGRRPLRYKQCVRLCPQTSDRALEGLARMIAGRVHPLREGHVL